MLDALRRFGILGINRRNISYTMKWNERRHYPLVDDKIATKRLCEEAGIPVPRLLAVARHHFEMRGLLAALADHDSFVLKPARGAMGNGILVVVEREGDRFLSSAGRGYSQRPVPVSRLGNHLRPLLPGGSRGCGDGGGTPAGRSCSSPTWRPPAFPTSG